MAKETKQAIGIEIFSLAQFVENEENPRKKAEDTTQMVDSLLIFPKMLSVRPLAYTKTEDKLLVLGGNYRLRGLNEIAGYTLDIIKERLSGMIGWEKKSDKEQAALLAFWKKWLAEPVAYGICLDGMTVEEKKEFIIKDNLSYGQWDEEALRGWNREAVEEWGLDVEDWERSGLSTKGREGDEAYNAFKAKYEAKLTTDDCYTPPEVYEVVKDWVDKNITPLRGRKVIRPFYPGGDYEHQDYPEGCIVLDNPPFSISSKILDFYLGRGIPFFLFGNGLTLCACKREGLTYVIVGEGIVFENGANINIGFYTNLCPEVRIWLAGDLAEKIREVQKAPESLPNIKWDIHIQSAALLSKIAKRVNLKIMADECELIGNLSTGQAIFGGMILSDTAARRADEARRQADEARRQADEARRQADEARGVSGALGEKEREIVRNLNRKAER